MTQVRFLTTLGLFLTSALIAAEAGTIPRDVSLAPLVKQVSPAVVNISTRGTVTVQQNPMMNDEFFRRFFPQVPAERQVGALGSGVIVDARNGYLLTNNHVIDQADEISVRLTDGRRLSAEVVGTDAQTDIAVLKIKPDRLTELQIGNSEALEVGDYVMAIGNPFGLGGTVTTGIVSAKGRSDRINLGDTNYQDFIQTDAAINSGNSGGALVNLQGELIGINTAIVSRGGGSVGIGFAVPSEMVKAVMNQILEYGSVARGLLGVTGQPLTPELASALGLEDHRGALITSVIPDSAAEEAGLKEEDVITEANGKTVEDFDDLRNVVGFIRPGQNIRLTVLRNGKHRTVNARIRGNSEQVTAQTSPDQSADRSNAVAGASLTDIPRDHPLFGEVEGIMVDNVPRGSDAEQAGLRRGDIITQINRQPVKSLKRAIKALNSNDRNLVKVYRRDGSGSFFVVLS